MNNTQPTAVFLIGAPGSGKSTYAVNFTALGYKLISTDAYIERFADAAGKKYGDVFKDTVGAAEADMKRELDRAITAGENVVWDQTNMTVKTRAPKVSKLVKAGYNVIAVTFEVPMSVIVPRLEKRAMQTGKDIPFNIVASMLSNYQRPTGNEGFSKINIVTD